MGDLMAARAVADALERGGAVGIDLTGLSKVRSIAIAMAVHRWSTGSNPRETRLYCKAETSPQRMAALIIGRGTIIRWL